ncbi:phytanoyl-CoA dioxygenase family protein [Dictyobacter kobayashii]|uniref:SnoK n=1 Tax=Dictyobacter kobayashii TaxID=2014872 RepID=A0A402AJC1_9CHLR|nr:phytanoyl-CoA dioxygenase family protein [Dictyobacter kobayashii]GCE19196.1 SnoK [Dictyobacter kobayashii]
MTATYPISAEQIRFYQENGYIQLLNVLTAEELAQARQALDEVLEQQLDQQHEPGGDAEYRKIFVQKVNLWQVNEGMRQYVFNAKLAEIARQLAQAHTVRLWHDHALIKMPGDSKASSWHQDIPYWPMQEDGSLSCWMALDDVYVENGCMAFIPESHRLGRLEPINLRDPQDLFKLVPEEQARTLDFTARYQPMPAGSCTFHDGRTFHYAGPNQSAKPRRAIITIYMPNVVHYNGNSHIVTNDLQLEPGATLTGERFPVLAQEA